MGLMLAALIGTLASLAVPAKAAPSDTVTIRFADVVVNNNTKYDSWVDFSWSYTGQAWHIEKAMCIRPHSWGRHSIRYNHPDLGPVFRLRAEIKLAGCANGTHTVLTGVAPVVDSALRANVDIEEPSPGKFYLKFPDKV
jgi:hypothetical protein